MTKICRCCKRPLKSSQTRWQEARIQRGLCGNCGQEPLAPGSKRLGMKCLILKRERARAKIGAKRRNLNSKSYEGQD